MCDFLRVFFLNNPNNTRHPFDQYIPHRESEFWSFFLILFYGKPLNLYKDLYEGSNFAKLHEESLDKVTYKSKKS